MKNVWKTVSASVALGLVVIGTCLLCGWGVAWVFGLPYFKGLVAWVLASTLAVAIGGSNSGGK